MKTWYNENERYPALWLRNLIAAGHLPEGEVDERSIVEVGASDLAGVTQAHYFAGIGGWPLALRMAGWPNDRPVWTGSCPCQPFSAAGRRRGVADERHLWPAWFRLIRECRPPVVFGEQVASPAGLAWFDLVSADLEGEGYAVGAADLCAAGVGAPHLRQRLFFVAHSEEERCATGTGPQGTRSRPTDDGSSGVADSIGEGLEVEREQQARREREAVERGGAAGELDLTDVQRCNGQRLRVRPRGQEQAQAEAPRGGAAGELGDAEPYGREESNPAHASIRCSSSRQREQASKTSVGLADAAGERARIEGEAESGGNGQDLRVPWVDCDWLPCRDGFSRPVEPGTFPLAHGIPRRVGKLRAYGNAIVSPLAAQFIKAFMGV